MLVLRARGAPGRPRADQLPLGRGRRAAGAAAHRLGDRDPAVPAGRIDRVLRRRPSGHDRRQRGQPGGRAAASPRPTRPRAAAGARRRPRVPAQARTRSTGATTRTCCAAGRRTSRRRENDLRKRAGHAHLRPPSSRRGDRPQTVVIGFARMRRIDAGRVGIVAAAVTRRGHASPLVLARPDRRFAHEERERGRARRQRAACPAYRTDGPTLLVCKTRPGRLRHRIAAFPAELKAANLALWTQCQTAGYRHLQEAVNNVKQPGMIIKILPGVYHEEPSLADPAGGLRRPRRAPGRPGLPGALLRAAGRLPATTRTSSPILDKRDLQIEGTGAKPEDVVIDAQYQQLNAIRADRASGIYLRNFTAQRTTFNAVYILESDGFVIDKLIGRWNDEYGFLTFADDHGLYTDCEAYGNGDSGIYPGAAANINADAGPRRRPVRHRDPELQQPPQPAGLLRHGRRLGLGARQRLHRQHRRRRHRQRVPRPPGPAAEPRPVREQRHRRQQRGLLPLRPRRHLREAVRASAGTRTAWSARRSACRSAPA